MSVRILFVPWFNKSSSNEFGLKKELRDFLEEEARAGTVDLENIDKFFKETERGRLHRDIEHGGHFGGEYHRKNQEWFKRKKTGAANRLAMAQAMYQHIKAIFDEEVRASGATAQTRGLLRQAEILLAAAQRKTLRTWEEAWFTGEDLPRIVAINGNANAQIYIRGHSKKECNTIFSGESHLSADLVATRLQSSGLDHSFAGKIKCYNCFSAVAEEANAFAQEFANAMHHLGYRQCSFWGYNQKLSSYPSKKVNKGALDFHHNHCPGDDEEVRASTMRVQVVPV